MTELTRDFWIGGAAGELRMYRCQDCRTWTHPPRPRCTACGSRSMSAEATSGRGTVFSFTVTPHPWRPSLPVPYVIALIELDDQPGLRLTSNVVGCPPAEVRIGLTVEVVFVAQDDVHVPLFQPAA